MYELIILGGGPAGMTAAVYAARKRIRTLLLSKDIGGQVVWTMGIENYMGYQFIEGADLMQKFEEQVRQFSLEIKIGPGATHIRKIDSGFEVEADDGAIYQAKSVIVATGKRPRPLNVPGEERLRGRGVTYCSICDGPIFAGQRVAVIGGGNSALGAAEEMVKIAEHVDMVSITPLTGDQVLIDKITPAPNIRFFLEHEVLEIAGTDRVESITVRGLQSKETEELAVGGIFVEIGLIPNSDLARDVVNRNRAGEIEVNCANETNVAGLFAAGDVTNAPEKQIVIAAGEGAKASLSAHRYLQRL
ncbi:MAG TPA: thioredoxin-disulfide reductase [Dehalococcoidia bacterium]|nr:thioredoxin-disulfide reductase [Dehalococcoidia bacterium]